MDPSTAKKKPKPIIAILAVALPLLAIGIAAVATSTGSSDQSATATTLAQDGDPGADPAAPKEPGTTAGAGGDATTTTAASDGTTVPAGGEAAEETPSTARNTGPEAERTTVTYPQPTVPEGGCSRPSGTATITLGKSPSPACLELGPDQPVIVRNRTGREISFVAISVNEVIAPGTELRIGSAASAFGDGRSTFWSPGNPQLSGIVVVG